MAAYWRTAIFSWEASLFYSTSGRFEIVCRIFEFVIKIVAHNAAFDSGHLLRCIEKNDMIENFLIVAGFSDTFTLFKRAFPERKKGEKMFKLQTLAEDLLKSGPSHRFHEALYDVEILEKLTTAFIEKTDLCKVRKTYKKSMLAKVALPSLKILKSVISDTMLNKIAGEGIDYKFLKET